MVSRLFRFIFKLLLVALLVAVLTAAWMICDGLSDQGTHTDVGLVPGWAEVESDTVSPQVKARLDRAIELYRAERFPSILLGGGPKLNQFDETNNMLRYLKQQGIPGSAIVADPGEGDTHQQAAHWARVLRDHRFASVTLVTDYYQMTRLKLALHNAGFATVDQAHVGKLDKGDIIPIVVEVGTFYDYVWKYFLLPEAKVLSKEAGNAAGNAKKTVDEKLDSLSK